MTFEPNFAGSNTISISDSMLGLFNLMSMHLSTNRKFLEKSFAHMPETLQNHRSGTGRSFSRILIYTHAAARRSLFIMVLLITSGCLNNLSYKFTASSMRETPSLKVCPTIVMRFLPNFSPCGVATWRAFLADLERDCLKSKAEVLSNPLENGVSSEIKFSSFTDPHS